MSSFKPDYEIIMKWWAELDNAREKTKKSRVFTTADSALLRRAKSVNDVILTCPAFHILLDRLNGAYSMEERNRLALIAGVLAFVRSHTDKTLASQLKKLAEKSDSVELRFRRLIQTSEPNDVLYSMVRVIKLVGESVNVYLLAKSLYEWQEPITKKQWAYDFY